MPLSPKALIKNLFRRFTKPHGRVISSRAKLNVTQLEDRTVPTPVVTVAALANLTEGGSFTSAFRLTRTDTTGYLNINYSFGGSPNFMDYSEPLIVSFADGEATTDVSLYPFDDSTAEPTETVIFNILSGSGYTVGTANNATVSLFDNETPVVSVSVENATEGDDTGRVRFTRLGSLASGITVNYSVSGTATSGTDYTAIGTSVAIAANADYADVLVTALRDNLVEGNETVIATIGSGSGYSIGTPSSGTLTIVDDPPVIAVTASDTAEGSANGGFTFTRSGGNIASALTVSYSVSGTATSTTDYTALTGSVTFAADQDRVEVWVEAFGDNTNDDAETVIATLTGAGTNYVLDDDADVATVNIADQPLTISVLHQNDGEEGAGNATFRFYRSGDISSSLSVNYTVSGTAVAGTDYTALSGSVTFAANDTYKDVTVTITNDSTVEGTEVVTVTLDEDEDYSLGVDSASIFIRDNDTQRVYWVSTSSTDWNTAANWSANTVPTSTDDVYISGSYSNVSITNLGSGGSSLAFAGLHIVGAYSGTVSLAVPLTVGTYEQTTGTLRQGNATYDLTVNDAFLWTGGILNDTDSGASVDIASAVGRMDPPDSTSLAIATASTLNISSGSVVMLLPGILEFLGGDGMTIVGEVKGVTNIANVSFHISNSSAFSPVLKITSGGALTFTPLDISKTGEVRSDVPIDSRGLVDLQSGIHFKVLGRIGAAGPSILIMEATGALWWQTGANIEAEHGLTIETGGSLQVQVRKPNTEARLVGNLVYDGVGASKISFHSSLLSIGTFFVQGNAEWVDGVFETRIGETRLRGDSWVVSGSFTVGTDAKVSLDVSGSPAQAQDWKVLECQNPNGFTGSPTLLNLAADYLLKPDDANKPKKYRVEKK